MLLLGRIRRKNSYRKPFEDLVKFNSIDPDPVNNFLFNLDARDDIKFNDLMYSFKVMRSLRLRMRNATLTLKCKKDEPESTHSVWVIAPREGYEGYVRAVEEWESAGLHLLTHCTRRQEDEAARIEHDAVWAIWDGIIICRTREIARAIMADIS